MSLQTLEKRVDGLEKKFDVGFANLSSQIEDLAICVKNGFDRIDERFEQVDARFDQMDKRFDRIENVSIGNHDRRIENLEDDMRVIKTKVGLRKNK